MKGVPKWHRINERGDTRARRRWRALALGMALMAASAQAEGVDVYLSFEDPLSYVLEAGGSICGTSRQLEFGNITVDISSTVSDVAYGGVHSFASASGSAEDITIRLNDGAKTDDVIAGGGADAHNPTSPQYRRTGSKDVATVTSAASTTVHVGSGSTVKGLVIGGGEAMNGAYSGPDSSPSAIATVGSSNIFISGGTVLEVAIGGGKARMYHTNTSA